MSSTETTAWLQSQINASLQVNQTIRDSKLLLEQIARVGQRVSDTLINGQPILLFGNGGSAADAQHIAAELVGRFYKDRRPLPAIALTTNASILTSIGNDYDFTQVFSRQIEALGKRGDVAMGISTSGASPNVARGIETARRLGLYTVALTGLSGGDLRAIAEECICVPATETPRIQEAHILIGHLICEYIERTLFVEGGE